MQYNRPDDTLIEKLRHLVGAENVLTDSDSRETYGRDETEEYFFPPDIVVKPATALEISAILKIANDALVPVTPRGGGTGLSGGALPVFGGIVLSLERMSRIIEIDRQNLQATVEPGVTTQRLQEEAERFALFYPPDPSSRGTSHIGGNLAECAGGPRAVKYGVTKDYVLALEAVLPTGDVISTGARVLKNVSGYNLTQLLIGSEGTLGIITRVHLRLIPLPKFRRVVLVAFRSLQEAAEAVAAIFQSGITPSALEFMERAAVEVAEERLGKKFPNSHAEAQLFLEVDGNHGGALDDEIMGIAEVVQARGAVDVLLATDRVRIDDVWALRRGIGEAVKSISPYKEEDTVVPRTALPRLVRGVKEICARYGVRSICYGHAGDGNVHVNILKDSLDDSRWRAVETAVREILELTVSLGGTISGEHGIGYSQRGFLPIALSSLEIRLMREIKRVFDPRNILNPGKIFPGEAGAP